MALKFDVNGAITQLLNLLEHELYYAFEAWKNEVLTNMQHPFYKQSGEVEVQLNRESKKLVAFLRANSFVLADSFGTGSLMLDDIPIVKEYLNSSKGNEQGQINPARKGKAIVGRPTGTYTDIFGRTHKTTGEFEGENIEGMKVNESKKNTPYYITPTPPSKAIIIANKWLYDTYLPRAYQNAVKRMNFSTFLIEY